MLGGVLNHFTESLHIYHGINQRYASVFVLNSVHLVNLVDERISVAWNERKKIHNKFLFCKFCIVGKVWCFPAWIQMGIPWNSLKKHGQTSLTGRSYFSVRDFPEIRFQNNERLRQMLEEEQIQLHQMFSFRPFRRNWVSGVLGAYFAGINLCDHSLSPGIFTLFHF